MELKLVNNNTDQLSTINNETMSSNLSYDIYNITTTDINNESVILRSVVYDSAIRIDPLLYFCFTPIMIFISFISVIVNIKILCSIYWIRRPISPTLQISLSLAAADGVASFLLGFGLYMNSLLPLIKRIEGLDRDCYRLSLEAFRSSSVICSVIHLLALTGNHYLGILRPLHYSSLMTGRNTKIILIFLWLIPNLFFFIYFLNEGFLNNCNPEFLATLKFRMIYAPLFFIPFIIMIIIYGHIYVIIKKHQKQRAKFINNDQCSTRRSSRNRNKQQQIMNKNMKAIRTTMYIIGSYFIGLIPLTIEYCLVCKDCVYKLQNVHKTQLFYLLVLLNTLCISKTLVNPLIYAARMQEIKSASIKMNTAFYSKFCGTRAPRRNSRTSFSTTHKHSKSSSNMSNVVCTKV